MGWIMSGVVVLFRTVVAHGGLGILKDVVVHDGRYRGY
jgi:hypothetical protein